MTTDLPTLIRDIEAGPVTRELNDRVLRALGWVYHTDPAPSFAGYWLDPHGMRFDHVDRPAPLNDLQDATLAVPEGETVWWEVRQMYAPNSMAKHFATSNGMFNARVGLDYGEDGHLGQSDEPPIALTLACLKAEQAKREAEG